MPALVRHHPGEGSGKSLAERREKWSYFDLCKIQPGRFADQSFPFILRFHKIRQQFARIIDLRGWTHVLWSANSELGRRLSDPDQKTALHSDVKWSGADFLVLPALTNGLFYQGLHDRRCSIEMKNAFSHRPFPCFRLLGELFRREA